MVGLGPPSMPTFPGKQKDDAPNSAANMSLSSAGEAFLKQQEGLRLSPYNDIGNVATIGYGHTGTVRPGQPITKAEAQRLLNSDVAKAQRAIASVVRAPMTQGQYDALVSFAFNNGWSTKPGKPLANIAETFNTQGPAAALQRMGLYVNAAGQPGVLANRRVAEAAVFNGTLPNGGNPDIAALQQKLASAGFNPGKIDGIMGPNTQAALDAQREMQVVSARSARQPIAGATAIAGLGRPPSASSSVSGFPGTLPTSLAWDNRMYSPTMQGAWQSAMTPAAAQPNIVNASPFSPQLAGAGRTPTGTQVHTVPIAAPKGPFVDQTLAMATPLAQATNFVRPSLPVSPLPGAPRPVAALPTVAAPRPVASAAKKPSGGLLGGLLSSLPSLAQIGGTAGPQGFWNAFNMGPGTNYGPNVGQASLAAARQFAAAKPAQQLVRIVVPGGVGGGGAAGRIGSVINTSPSATYGNTDPSGHAYGTSNYGVGPRGY